MISGVRYTYEEISNGLKNEKEFKKFDSTLFQFEICSLTFLPCTEPLICPFGYSFSIEASKKYFNEKNKHPFLEEYLNFNDLIEIKIIKDEKNNKIDPLTLKPLNNRSKIILNKKSKYIYDFETINQFNLKTNFFKDLMTGEDFNNSDLILIHDLNRIINYPENPFITFLNKKETLIEKNTKLLINTFNIIKPNKEIDNSWYLSRPNKESFEQVKLIKLNPPKIKPLAIINTNLGEIIIELDLDICTFGVINFIGHVLKGNYNSIKINKIDSNKSFEIKSSNLVDETVWNIPIPYEKNDFRKNYQYPVFYLNNNNKELKIINTSNFCIGKTLFSPNNYFIFGGIIKGQGLINLICNSQIYSNGIPIKTFLINSIKIENNILF